SDNPAKIDPGDLKGGELSEGTETGEIKPLAPRIDKAKTMEEIENQESGVRSQQPEAAETRPSGRVQGSGQHATEADAVPLTAGETPALPAKQETGEGLIEITDFSKIDLRVGEVRSAE